MQQDKKDLKTIHGLINYFNDVKIKSNEYPYNILSRYGFLVEEGSDYFIFLLTLETSLFNLLPDSFFKMIIKKGIKKAGFNIKLNFLNPKDFVIKENFGAE